jgi:hypothetical protein
MRRPSKPKPASTAEPFWAGYDDERLLDVRMCDLGVTIACSGLQPRLDELARELASRGLLFRPHYWIGEEWLCPDGVPGVSIPFYLTHPRLMKLELAQCLEVEGGTREWCLKILRHEAGHAIENAFKLRGRPMRRRLFGSTNVPYPKAYDPRPYSKSYVLHLDNWYAQSHPDEDFAETFAVWLTPGSDWRRRYAGWPALKKLEYMDVLMRELARLTPPVRTRRAVEPVSRIRKTLRAHYRRKRRFYGLDRPHVYDQDLLELFTDAPGRGRDASEFITRVGPDMRRRVAGATGTYQYTIDRLLKDIQSRCRELRLRLRTSESETRVDFAVLLTAQVMEHVAHGRHRVAL